VRKNLPDPRPFLGLKVPRHEPFVLTELVGSGCNAHVFKASASDLVQELACKVIPVSNLIGTDQTPPLWQEEIKKATLIASSRVVRIYDVGSLTVDGCDCVYLLSDLVRGVSLQKFVKTESQLSVSFITTFLGEMFDFLRELQEAKVQHGDFHEGNILVEDRSSSFLGPPYAFRITDFGVAKVTSDAPQLDDFDQLAVMLRRMLEKVDYQSCSPEDRFTFNALNDDLLSKSLLERDSAFDPRARKPAALFAWLSGLHSAYLSSLTGTTRRTLITPFDYLNCEQIGESHVLLKELYSDKMLGLTAIEDVNNLVLTGPRGCGKTTVFRSLSLKHRFHTQDDSPNALRYIGIYYRCDDLYFNFPRYQLPARAEALDLPLHFVTATLVKELLAIVSAWMQRHFNATWTNSEAPACVDLWAQLALDKPKHVGVDSFAALQKVLDKERSSSAKKQRFVNDPTHSFHTYFGPDVLPRVCETLTKYFPELQQRPIYFFIDDYSTPKITGSLQKSLNRLFMQRSAACFFKLATESPASFASSDVDGKAYVEGREFKLINIGIDFIGAEREDKLRFVDDIFGRRFSYAQNYPVKTLNELIGDDVGEISQNEVARNIRAGKYPTVWGRRVLGDLCSGDVHFLIELVGKMVGATGGKDSLITKPGEPAIEKELQNKTIRAEAGNFLKNLRALPNGQALVEVVEAFGSVAASHLRFRDSKNESSTPPHQASRIEPFEDPHLEGWS
jgi:energy-coupling factor transporter ATP-binding protein EcfA2